MTLKNISSALLLSAVAFSAAALLPATAHAQAGVTGRGADSAQPPASGQEANLPSADEVFKAAIEAMGGREAIEALKQMKATGSFSMPTVGLNAEMVMLVDDSGEKPLSKMSIDLPGIGKIVRGLTADGGYEVNPMQGNRKLEGPELESAIEDADLQANLDPAKYYKSWKTIGRETVDGTPTIVVELIDKNDKSKKLYFATEGPNKNLVIQSESVDSTPMGDVPSTAKISDYREVEGPGGKVKMSFKTDVSSGGQQIIVTMKEINLQPDLKKEDLAAPADL